MSRGRLVVLGLLAAVLVSGGAVPVLAPANPTGVFASGFDAEDVAWILQRVNPALSSQQRQRIGAAVLRYSEKYGIDPQLVTAVLLVESSARPWARSRKGAIGLMQVMPHMAEPLEPAGNLTTIESNVEAGCFILADNIRRLGEEDGISAYFWGTEIRDASYLDRVREARAAVRRLSRS
jgi:soluble lytic murein transglycosylase-like protein